MSKEQKIRAIESGTIAFLWIVAIVAPLLFVVGGHRNINAVYVLWAEYCIIAFAFAVNRFVLVPFLFSAKRYGKYLLGLGILLLVIALFIFFFDGVNMLLSAIGIDTLEAAKPIVGGGGMPCGGAPLHSAPPHGMPPLSMPPSITVIPPNVTVLVLSAIVIALDMGINIAVRWVISEQKQAEMKRERVSTQLASLQNQVSPHFFMNTLNNIHALVEIDPQRAQKTIIELSGLMDYLLYESSNIERVSLQRELEFIESYINLMRLRYPKRVAIDYSYSECVPHIKIPPLLFLNFIENTFKYGVDYTKESFIRVRFDFTECQLIMTTQNSNHAATVKRKRPQGIGISNSHKRLKLLYGSHYTLDIDNGAEVYSLTLKIPIEP